MPKTNTPREVVEAYLGAWRDGDVFRMFAELHLSCRYRITAAELFSKIMNKPIDYTVFDDENIEGLDGTIIRDVNIGIDFGTGEKPARMRCVCEKVGIDNLYKPSSTPDGGEWGVNPNSLRLVV